jgi:diphosphomevalonate decarboxylase
MSEEIELRIKYRSSPNIAWIKYWGKYDEEYILPINDSLGVTLNQDDINTETSIIFTKNM